MLPQLHNEESDMIFRNRSSFIELQQVRKRVSKICEFGLPVR